MRAEQIMSSPVVTVHERTPVREAAALMAEHRITSLPVVDDDGALIGVVSEIDLLRRRIAHDPRTQLRPTLLESDSPGQLVRDVMTDTAICLSRHADAADVAQALVTNRIRAIPIIDGTELVGIVSRRDLLRTLLRDDTAMAAEVQERLDAYAGDAGRWQAEVREGEVSISGDAADDRTRHAIESLARTVPGVVRVHLLPAGLFRRHHAVG